MTLAEAWPYLRDVAAGTAAVFALISYRNGQRQRRAEWLDELYSRFYEQPHYKRIRRILDYGIEPDLTRLAADVANGTASDEAEEFVDYLNFFEFLGSLHEMNQVSSAELSMMFEYYIARLNSYPFVVDFVNQQGFERLSAMLAERRIATVRAG